MPVAVLAPQNPQDRVLAAVEQSSARLGHLEKQSQGLFRYQGFGVARHAEVVETGDAEAEPSGVAAGSASDDDPVLPLLQEISGHLARLEGRALQGQDARDVDWRQWRQVSHLRVQDYAPHRDLRQVGIWNQRRSLLGVFQGTVPIPWTLG